MLQILLVDELLDYWNQSIKVNRMKVDLTKYVETHTFNFDEAFSAEQSNEEVYKRTAYPLVNYIFEGGKATCFA